MEEIQEFRSKTTSLWATDFQQGCKDKKGRHFSTKGAGATEYPHAKECIWNHTSDHVRN